MRRLLCLVAALAAFLAFGPAARAATVSVLYAGSLVAMMEHAVGPAFDRTTGDHFEGFAGGSRGLANEIKGKLRRADVFLSASPKVNATLMGPSNGDWVDWYIRFAQSPLVIGYNSKSRFAHDLQTKPWWQVLTEPGFRLGRTDPKLDPKGALTVALVNNAQARLKQPGLAARILGDPAQVLPEEALVGRLQSGQLDAGFFYSTETSEAHIPTVQLPASIRLKAIYTITIVRNAPDPIAAARFGAFLLGDSGRKLLTDHGLDVLPPKLFGNASTVPASLQPLLAGK